MSSEYLPFAIRFRKKMEEKKKGWCFRNIFWSLVYAFGGNNFSTSYNFSAMLHKNIPVAIGGVNILKCPSRKVVQSREKTSRVGNQGFAIPLVVVWFFEKKGKTERIQFPCVPFTYLFFMTQKVTERPWIKQAKRAGCVRIA